MNKPWQSLWWVMVSAAMLWVLSAPGWSFGQTSGETSGGPPPLTRTVRSPQLTIVLEPTLTLPVGAQATYVITNTAAVYFPEATGAHASRRGMEMEETIAAWVRYTFLSPDSQTAAPRIQAEVVPIDPQTGNPLEPAPYMATFVVTGTGVQLEDANRDLELLRYVIGPEWLVSWTYTPAEQLPRAPVGPGFTWQGDPARLLSEGFGPQLQGEPLTGRFVGWVDLPGGVRAAHVEETSRAGRATREPVIGGGWADVAFETTMRSEFWLVPGDLPARAVRRAEATTRTVIEGVEGFLAAGMNGSFTQVNVWEWTLERAEGTDPFQSVQSADAPQP